jgi:hypothetical protein
MGRLVVQVTTGDQGGTGRSAAALTAGQTRQTGGTPTLVRVEVRGADLQTPVAVTCPLVNSTTPPCQVTETPTAFLVSIELVVPLGPARTVSVQVFGEAGTAVLEGTTTVNVQDAQQTIALVLRTINTPPIAQAGADQTVAVGTTVTLQGNQSSDVDGQPLTFAWVLVLRPSGSQASLVNPASVTPTLVIDRSGTYMVQLTVNDGQVDSPPDVVTITTSNSAPVANAGAAQSVAVGTTVTLQGNRSSDVDGDVLAFQWTLLSRPASSQAVLVNATTVNPTFVVDRVGTYVAQLIVNDGLMSSVPATVTITTRNSAPVAQAGANQTIRRGATVTLNGSASSDVDGNTLTFAWSLTTRPVGSTAALSNATSVTPTLVVDQPGTYVVQLIVNDGTTDSAPVTVTITTTNSAPVANAGAAQSVAVGTVVRLDGRASSDPDNDPLTFVWSFTTVPANSTATLANPSTAQPTFTVDRAGTYVVQLIVNDGLLNSTPVTVTVSTLNSAPVADAGSPQAVRVGSTVALDGSASRDADQDPLTFVWALTTRPLGSTATLSNPTSVRPTFVVDRPGTYVAQLMVNDGTVSSTPATVMITTLNTTPIADAGPAQTVNAGVLVTLNGQGSSDADGDPLTFRWTQTSGPGVTLSSLTIAQPTFTAPVTTVDTALIFQLVVNDGTLDSAPAHVTITVHAANQPPTANAQAVSTDRDTAVGITLSGADPDSPSLSFSIVSGPSHGSVGPLGAATCTPNGAGVTCTAPVTYTPAAHVTGTDSFTFQVNDSSLNSPKATVTITVNAINMAPTANAQTVSTDGETPTAIILSGADLDSPSLSFSIASPPNHGSLGPLAMATCTPNGIGVTCTAAVTYTPTAAGAVSTPGGVPFDSFTFQVNDGSLDSTPATVDIVFGAANSAPVATDDTYITPEDTVLIVGAPGVLGNDNDTETPTTLTAILVATPAHGQVMLHADGSFTYTPEAHFNGTVTFTYKANDGALDSNIATVSITVNAVNNVPVAQNDGYSTAVDVPLHVPAPGVLANDNDTVDGSTTLTAVLGALPTHGMVTLQPDGAFIYTPHAHFTGTDSFTYQAMDTFEALSNLATVTITIPSNSAAPVALNDMYTTSEDTPLMVPVPGVLTNDSPSSGLTASVVVGPLFGTLTLQSGGAFTYTPQQDFNGNDSFTYKANNGTLDSNIAMVTLTVTAVDDAPVAAAGPDQTVSTGATVTLDGSGSHDVEGATLTYAWTLLSRPSGSTAALLNATSVHPTFVPDLLGAYTAQLIVNDGTLNSAPDTVVITAQAPSISLALLNTTVVGVGRPATLRATLSAPAPTGGVTVTVSSDQPTILTVTAPGTVVIPQGSTTGDVIVNGLAPGSALTRGNAPGYTEGTLNVPVTLNLISLPTTLNVPFGQTVSIPVTIAPNPAPSGGVVVNLVSNAAANVEVVAPTVTIPQGSQSANGTVRGAAPGTAMVTASNPNYASATSQVSTTANLNIVQTSATVNGGFPTDITVQLESAGIPIAAPAPGISVTLVAADPTCAAVTSPVTIPAGLVSTSATLTYGGTATRPCTTTVQASAPNITSDTVNVTVNPTPALTVSVLSGTVGAGLQVLCCRVFLGAPAPPGGLAVQLQSSDPSALLLSPDGASLGAATLTLMIPAGNLVSNFVVVQGLETTTAAALPAAVTLTASAPGFTNGSGTVMVVTPGVQLASLGSTITTLSPDMHFVVQVGIPNAINSSLSQLQEVRGGSTPLTATVTNSTAAVAQLVTSSGAAQSRTVQIMPGQVQSPSTVIAGGIALDPLAAGTTTVNTTIPGVVSTTAASKGVTVSTPALTVAVSSGTVGAGLQILCCRVFLAAPAPPAGLAVQLQSSDPSTLLLAPDAASLGSDMLTLMVTAGNTVSDFVVIQGLETTMAAALPAAVTLTASAPGFTNGSGAVMVVTPGVQLSSITSTTTTLSPDIPFMVHVGIPNAPTNSGLTQFQAVRIGSTALTATVTNSSASVAQLITSSGAAQSHTVQIAPGQSQSPSTVAAGGIALDPLAAGTTTISTTIPNVVTTTAASKGVMVSAPALTVSVSSGTVGAGLQVLCCRVFLGAPAPPGGLAVQLRSSDPSILLLAPDAASMGSATLMLTVAEGNTVSDFVVIQGLETTTAAALPAAVTLTASAPGFTNGTGTVMVVAPGVQLGSLTSSTTTLTPDIPFVVQVGIPNAPTNSGLTQLQAVRVGSTALTATVTNSTATVAQLITSDGADQSRMVQIAPGQSQSPGTVAAGGIAFDPLTAGMTTVSVSIPGVLPTAAASKGVTVSAPALTVSVSSGTVGAGLQVLCCRVFLGAPAPSGGLNIQLQSSNPSTLLLAPDAATAGSGVLTLTVAAGNTISNFVVIQGLETAMALPATVTLTATAPGFTDGTATATVVQPALDIASLATSLAATAPDDPFTVRVGLSNTPTNSSLIALQAVRIGGPTLTATVSNSTATVGQLTTSNGSGQSGTVQITPGQQQSPSAVATGGIAFDPLAAGSTAVGATIPHFIATNAATVGVTVTP